jgi:hypothetical protein
VPGNAEPRGTVVLCLRMVEAEDKSEKAWRDICGSGTLLVIDSV